MRKKTVLSDRARSARWEAIYHGAVGGLLLVFGLIVWENSWWISLLTLAGAGWLLWGFPGAMDAFAVEFARSWREKAEAQKVEIDRLRDNLKREREKAKARNERCNEECDE